MSNFDVIIVGAGPVAIRAAEAILKQTKSIAIVKQSHQWDSLYYGYLHYLAGTTPDFTIESIQDKVTLIEGPCRFIKPSTLEAQNTILSASKILLAPGFEPQMLSVPLNGVPATFPWQIQPSNLEKSSLVSVIGGGPLGVSIAFHLLRMGIKPTVITKGPRLLTREEPQIGQFINDRLIEAGSTIIYNTQVEKSDFKNPWIPAMGIKPSSKSLNLSAANVYTNSQEMILTTDDLMTSAQKNVWAIGSARSGRYLLNEEREDAEIAANNLFENIFNIQRKTSDPFPVLIPTNPPIASIGLTESQALKRHLSIKTSVTSWETPEKGLIKLVAKKRSGQLLGAHVVGHRAGEIISFFSLVMRGEISLTDLIEPYHHAELSYAPRIADSIRKWVLSS